MKAARIESVRNPLVVETLGMLRRRPREAGAAFVVEGPHLLQSALDAGGKALLKRVFFTADFAERHGGLLARAEGAGAELLMTRGHVMRKLSDTEAPQGVIGVVEIAPTGPGDLGLSGVTVVLDAIQDPGNAGSIIRTADAAGLSEVVCLPGTCDPYSQKALRASAGSVFNVRLASMDRASLIEALRGRGVPLLVASPEAGLSLFDADLSPPLALAFGNEAAGASAELKEAAFFLVSVPILGRAESLNVAASAAVCIYEAVRRSVRKV